MGSQADLKQRRELIAGGSAEYFDQSTLQAALNGRVLIVEGFEKAERNVRPHASRGGCMPCMLPFVSAIESCCIWACVAEIDAALLCG